mmetsp:Transcript_13385/g.30279  ORF Transcript_13385/g.30279 Transcript_13385/m.30279 type:complete len:404 (-) Transcript_13385:288-1499(-)
MGRADECDHVQPLVPAHREGEDRRRRRSDCQGHLGWHARRLRGDPEARARVPAPRARDRGLRRRRPSGGELQRGASAMRQVGQSLLHQARLLHARRRAAPRAPPLHLAPPRRGPRHRRRRPRGAHPARRAVAPLAGKLREPLLQQRQPLLHQRQLLLHQRQLLLHQRQLFLHQRHSPRPQEDAVRRARHLLQPRARRAQEDALLAVPRVHLGAERRGERAALQLRLELRVEAGGIPRGQPLHRPLPRGGGRRRRGGGREWRGARGGGGVRDGRRGAREEEQQSAGECGQRAGAPRRVARPVERLEARVGDGAAPPHLLRLRVFRPAVAPFVADAAACDRQQTAGDLWVSRGLAWLVFVGLAVSAVPEAVPCTFAASYMSRTLSRRRADLTSIPPRASVLEAVC